MIAIFVCIFEPLDQGFYFVASFDEDTTWEHAFQAFDDKVALGEGDVNDHRPLPPASRIRRCRPNVL